jgi:protoporphyrinogen oxidase
MRDVGILGGGISGLFTGYFLGGDVEILEGDEQTGGLARCFGGEGFRSDIGGHILFSKDKEALAHELAVLGDNRRRGVRANKILYQGLHVKYPFENGIDVLPKEDIVDILHTFIDNPHKAKPTNFREWMYHVFGDGLTNRYMLPYNEKIWKTAPEQMSLEWVDRVPRPPLIDLIRTGVGIQTEGYTHQLYFDYPKKGGFEALPHTLAGKLAGKITCGFRVASVRPCEGGWVVTSTKGEERRYKQIVATIPITNLFTSLGEVPKEVDEAARALRFNSLRVVLVGVRGTDLPAYTALYVPAPESLYHRVCYNQVFSPDMVPDGHSSVSCEITVRPGTEVDGWSDEKLLERTVADLARDKVIDASKVCFRMVHREKFAYVVYDLGYANRVKLVRDYAETRGIWLAGRFAEYQYVNTDACVRRALDLARQLRGGDIAPEARISDEFKQEVARG